MTRAGAPGAGGHGRAPDPTRAGEPGSVSYGVSTEAAARAGDVARGVSREEFNVLAAWPPPGGGAPGIPEPLAGPLPGHTWIPEPLAGPLLDRTSFPDPMSGPEVDRSRSDELFAGPVPIQGSRPDPCRADAPRARSGHLLEPLALPVPSTPAPAPLRATIQSLWAFGGES